MAIVLELGSKCPICDGMLDGTKEYMLVPPITGNTRDSLFVFSDAGVHIDCLAKSGMKDILFFHIQKYNSMIPPSGAIYSINGQRISNPQDVVVLGLLTSDETEELSRYNYFVLDLSKLHTWAELDRFLNAAEEFVAEKKWEGLSEYNKIEWIIQTLKGCR